MPTTGRLQCDVEHQLMQPSIDLLQLGVSSESPRLQGHGSLNYPWCMSKQSPYAAVTQRKQASIRGAAAGVPT